MNQTRYFINTTGMGRILLQTNVAETKIPAEYVLLFKIKQCTEVEYNVFKYFWVNLKAPFGEKTAWLKRRVQKWLGK